VLLARRGVTGHLVRSAVTILVVALATTAVIGTSGRTEAARRTLLARLEVPEARLVRVVDRDGQAGLSPAAVSRIASLQSVAWVVGLSPAGPLGWNPALGGPRQGYASEAIGTRRYWGDLGVGPLIRVLAGRDPAIGEAVIGHRAAGVFGLADGAGTVDDEEVGPVAIVAEVAAIPPVENLGSYVLIRGDQGDASVTELLVLVRTSAQVEPFVERLPDLLGLDAPIGIERATELLSIRESLVTEAGELDAAILAASLISGALLIAAILYGAIEERRREFGLRRSQGATRSTIAALVFIESTVLAVVGSILGAIVGTALVFTQTDAVPDPVLTVAIGALVTLAAIAGSILPAAAAAWREPLYVLRSE
jgi:putative ABC transport system permease protein